MSYHILWKNPKTNTFTARHSSNFKFCISSHVKKLNLFLDNSIQVSIGIIEYKMVKMVVMAMGSVLSTSLPATHESSISSSKLRNINIPPKLNPALEIACLNLHKVQEVPKTSSLLDKDAIWTNPYSSRKRINIHDFANQKPRFEL